MDKSLGDIVYDMLRAAKDSDNPASDWAKLAGRLDDIERGFQYDIDRLESRIEALEKQQ